MRLIRQIMMMFLSQTCVSACITANATQVVKPPWFSSLQIFFYSFIVYIQSIPFIALYAFIMADSVIQLKCYCNVRLVDSRIILNLLTIKEELPLG